MSRIESIARLIRDFEFASVRHSANQNGFIQAECACPVCGCTRREGHWHTCRIKEALDACATPEDRKYEP